MIRSVDLIRITNPSIGNPKTYLEKLIQSLKYRNPFDSKNDPVIELMGIKDPNVVALLIKALKDPAPSIRENAALTLGYREEKSAVIPLIECLKDKDEYVCSTAALSLAKLKDKRALTELIKCSLENPAPLARRTAAIAIGKIDLKEGQEVLKFIADNDVDAYVRQAARAMLNLKV